jgi:hypothetical protein
MALLVGPSIVSCEVEDPPSRVPDSGGGGGVDPGAEGEGEAEGNGDEPTFESCVEAQDEGNQLGVGRYCEPDGDECKELDVAQFCSADFYPDQPSTGCTFPCSGSEECGEGSSCRPSADPLATGGDCVPTICLAVEG